MAASFHSDRQDLGTPASPNTCLLLLVPVSLARSYTHCAQYPVHRQFSGSWCPSARGAGVVPGDPHRHQRSREPSLTMLYLVMIWTCCREDLGFSSSQDAQVSFIEGTSRTPHPGKVKKLTLCSSDFRGNIHNLNMLKLFAPKRSPTLASQILYSIHLPLFRSESRLNIHI